MDLASLLRCWKRRSRHAGLRHLAENTSGAGQRLWQDVRDWARSRPLARRRIGTPSRLLNVESLEGRRLLAGGGPPFVLSIQRANANPTDASVVSYSVTFDETVTGVDPSDFALTTGGGIVGAAVSAVSGSGASYAVSVNTGMGSGTIRLDVVDDNSIVDASLAALGGAALGDGNFTTGQEYSFVRSAQASGIQWNDVDLNGARDGGEPGLSGWTVYADLNRNLRREPGEPWAVTDGSGNYTLTGLGAGTYYLTEELQPGWRQTAPTWEQLSVSVGSAAQSGAIGSSSSFDPSISQDGRYVAFTSFASNLVSGDLLGYLDVFVRDQVSGTVQRISTGLAGAEANGSSTMPVITPDGRYVAFVSTATNLVSNDTNGLSDVFVFDRQSGTLERISATSTGLSANGVSSQPRITPDGRFVTFYSAASNLVANDTNARTDIFVLDRQTATMSRATMGLAGAQPNGDSLEPSLSADGRWLAFRSSASNLVAGDTNAVDDIFLVDRQNTAISRISLNASGQQATGNSLSPTISADGAWIAFQSQATNLIPYDTNGKADVFVVERSTGAIERVSVAADGLEGNGDATYPVISADGRMVAFLSEASNLVVGDTNGVRDVFLMDRRTYAVRRVNESAVGSQPLASTSAAIAISPHGNFVAFSNTSNIFVAGDTNGLDDVFVTRVPLVGTRPVILSTGQSVTGADFGNRSLVGQIRGTLWNDLDGDRVVDAGETPLPGVTVFLDTNGNRQFDSGETIQVTDALGQYAFTNLPAGPYQVGEVIPAGWGQTSPGDILVSPLFQASIQDQPLNGSGDLLNSLTWLLSQSTTQENRVVAEFDTSPFVGRRLGSAYLDFDLFINNSGGDLTRTFNFYFYTGDGVASLDDFPRTSFYAGSVSRSSSGSTQSFRLTVTSGLQQALDAGATITGLVVDPVGSNLFATGIEKIRLTVAAPTVDAQYRFMLVPGQIRTGVNFGNRDVVPYVQSIVRSGASPTSAGTVDYTVTFSEAVTGVDPADFTVTSAGPTGASPVTVNGSGSVYTVSVATGTGDGSLRLDLIDNDTIRDAGNLGLGGPGAGNGNFTSGQLYVIDREAPRVTQISRVGGPLSNSTLVSFLVTFSEPVTSVDVADFGLTSSGLTGASVNRVVGSGQTYTVDAVTGSGQGTLRLDFLASATVLDLAGRPTATGFTTGESFDIDRIAPTVTSIVLLDPNPATAATVRYQVNFTEVVTGVDASDFTLTAVGPAGASISSVSGSGATYTVTVVTGSGDGRIRLNVLDNDSIRDLATNPTGGTYSTGPFYQVDRNLPAVASIVRTQSSPTSSSSVGYTVTFTEPVSGVDATDFALATSGLTGGSVTAVTGTDAVYTVTVSTGSGDGSLKLLVVDDDTITDGAPRPLGGVGIGNGNATGEVYGVVKTPGIYGTKWNDLDNDGVRDAGEPGLAGITIFLDSNLNGVLDGGELTTLTVGDNGATPDVDETGNYAFSGLAPGVFQVQEVVPAYHSQTYPPVTGGTGGLTFAGVVTDGTGGVDGLFGAASVAYSPDGAYVYSAAEFDDAVAVFRRHPATGALTFLQTIKQGDGGLNVLDGTIAVAVTPDGTQVLTTSNLSDAVLAFTRNPTTGLLTHRQTLRDGFSGIDGLDGAAAIALSADNKHAYVAGAVDSSVAVLQRDAGTGTWSFVQVFKDGVAGVDGLLGARAVAVSPDGLHVVAAGANEDKLAIFSRDSATGQLTYRGIVQDNLNGIDGLDGVMGLAFSPDGGQLYAAGPNDSAVAAFQRNSATHQLTFISRLKDGVGGADGLSLANSVTVAPDGRHVYVTGGGENAVAILSRNPTTGELTYLQRIQNNVGGVLGINSSASVVVSPDQYHVQVAGKASNALASFARDVGLPGRLHRVAWDSGQVILQRDFGNYRLPLQVVATEPPAGALVRQVPGTYRVHFNFEPLLSSVQAADLLVGGVPATAFQVIDADTIDFTLPVLAEGTHTVTMAAGSILQNNGPGLLLYQAGLTIDLTAPAVTVAPLLTTDTSPALSGTVNDPQAQVRVTVLGQTYLATNSGSGSWTLADNAISVLVPYGVHSLTVTATDPAGNVGTDSTANELEVIRAYLSVTGGSPIQEGGTYVVSLSHHSSLGTLTSWTIDWGDGSIQTIPGDPTSASHVYTDGPAGFSIRATAQNAVGTVFTSEVTASPDPQFGTGGFVTTPVSSLSTASQVDVVVQPDGRAVVVGDNGSNQWVIARHTTAGLLDATFGTAGTVLLSFPGLADSSTRPRVVVLQPDGKLLVAGNASQNVWAITRLLPTGALDPSFGSGGILQINRALDSRLYDLALDSAGRLNVVATEWQGSGSQGVLARMSSSGVVDTTFGASGFVLWGAGDNVYDGVESVVVTPDGKLVTGGYYDFGVATWAHFRRFDATGAADPTFGNTAYLNVPFTGSRPTVRALAVDDASRVVAALDLATSSDDDWGVIRLTRHGMLDRSFDQDGYVVLDLANTHDRVHDIVLQRDGRIVVAGGTSVVGSGDDLALARLLPNGALDTTLAGDGTWVLSPRPAVFERVLAVALAAEDRVLAVAGYQGTMELARLDLNAGGIARVNNVVPSVTVTGNATVVEGLPYTLQLSATDPGLDTIESWTIDWGDGVVEYWGGATSQFQHTYSAGPASRSVLITAHDEDGSYTVPGPTVAVTTAARGEVRGTKWNDTDNDGIQDLNEPGLGGITIYLDLNDNARLDSGEPTALTRFDDPLTTTDETGTFSFTGVTQGTYYVGEVLPAERTQTFPGVQATPVERISISTTGAQGNGSSETGQLSDDGRYVAFRSAASNLVPGDTNGFLDLFVHDRQLNTTIRANLNPDGSELQREVLGWSLSGNGRYVAYEHWRTMTTDQFTVRDLQTGSYIRNDTGSYQDPSLNSSGQYLAYELAGAAAGDYNVYVRDLVSMAEVLASRNSNGTKGNSNSGQQVVSNDGRYVVFTTHATDVPAPDTNQRGDVVIYDRVTGSVTRVSVSTLGEQGNDDSYQPGLSGDGRLVVFTSEATNLVPGDTNDHNDIFVRDRVTGVTERVSLGAGGLQANGDSTVSAISADGRYVLFRSEATNLVPGDTNLKADLFLRDRVAGTTERVSLGIDRAQLTEGSSIYRAHRALSADGKYLVFSTAAANVVAGDTNGASDTFVAPTTLGRRSGTHTISVVAGQVTSNVNFGSRGPLGEIRGQLWRDADGNGIREAGESSLPNRSVFLDLNGNDQWDANEPSQVTDSAGAYAFRNLLPGVYDVLEASPAGWQQTYPRPYNGDYTFLPVDANDHVYDPQRNLLYLTTTGNVLRYDVASRTFLSPFAVGTTAILGADITPDRTSLYVAGGTAATAFQKINLQTGAITAIPYAPALGEAAPWDVALASDGFGFLTTQFSGSGSVPLRKLDWRNDSVISVGTTDMKRNIWRSADQQMLLFDSFVFTPQIYEVATGALRTVVSGIQNAPVAISPDRSRIAVAGYQTLNVFDQNLANPVLTTGSYDLNGGIVFDPVRELLYVGNSSTQEVVAYDTSTWQVRFRFSGFQFGIQRFIEYTEGQISISADGKWLFVATGSAIQAVRLTPRHRVSLSADAIVTGIDFGARVRNFQPLQSTVAPNALLNVPPAQLRIVFNDTINPTSVQASDLTINGQAATGFTLDGANAVVFTLPSIPDGPVQATLAANAITSALGAFLSAWQTSFQVDTQAPTVTQLDPADNAPSAVVQTHLTLTLSEPIQKGSGSVTLRRSSDGLVMESFPVSSTRVTIAGNTATIDPTSNLADNTSYYVEVSAGAFLDLAGNPAAAISGPTAWNFTTNGSPKVAGLFVRGLGWSPDYLQVLANQGVGSATAGYRLVDGANQVANAGAVTWQSIDQISVAFTEEVALSIGSLRLLNSANQDQAFASTGAFSYDGATRTARWTLANPLVLDKFLIALAASSITDLQGAALDGEWSTSTTTYATAGDGVSGGNLYFRFNYLPGDVTLNGLTNTSDIGILRGLGTVVPGAATWRYDITANNLVNTSDVGIVRGLGTVTLIGVPDPQTPPPTPGGSRAVVSANSANSGGDPGDSLTVATAPSALQAELIDVALQNESEWIVP